MEEAAYRLEPCRGNGQRAAFQFLALLLTCKCIHGWSSLLSIDLFHPRMSRLARTVYIIGPLSVLERGYCNEAVLLV